MQWPSRRTLDVAAGICGIGFLLVAIWMLTGGSAHVDQAIMAMVAASDRPQAFADLMRALTMLGGVALRSLFALIAAGVLWRLAGGRAAIWLAATVLSGWIAEWLLKLLVARPRPEIAEHLAHASGYSFPSGHSFNSAVIYVSIALSIGAAIMRPARRRALLVLALLLSAAIAVSRVWLGVHWPSDIAAGWLGGTGWALAAHRLWQRR